MNSTLFYSTAEELFREIEESPELEVADLDRNGNVLTIEFDDGGQIVVNIQEPTQQVWLASRVCGGFHFSLKQGRWQDSEGRDFWDVLASSASALSGEAIRFRRHSQS